MFKKKNSEKKKSGHIDTLIGQYTHIKGDLAFNGGLRIDGSIAGNINAGDDKKSILTVSEQGSIEGDVRAPNLFINGTVTGNIYADEFIELAPKAHIQGNVYYRMLEMLMGAEVNGQLIRMADDSNSLVEAQHEAVDDSDALHLEQQSNLD